ncbi:MAG: glycosyltransferase [Verrucomicrobiota bacterium]
MHFLLPTVGTDGDVLPYVRLGKELRRRGHGVTLVAAEPYEPLAVRNGLAFGMLVSGVENAALFENPDFWNPLKSAPLAARWGMRFLERQYALISGLIRENTVIIANPGLLAAPLAAEKRGVPLVSLVLQPWMIPSAAAPPIMPGLAFLRSAPWPFWKLFWRGLDFGVDLLIGQELNRLRNSLGMKPARRILHHWLSRGLAMGMFPGWYGEPQTDWPKQLKLTGFPLGGGENSGELPVELLEFIRSGPAPVVFTFGTGMAQPGRQFRAALEACAMAGFRGIFLTKYPDQLPAPLPPSIFSCAFSPFEQLFPLCAAVVHHGGIGTAAVAMAAGVPQLVWPICFDQADNGDRLRKLGIGDCLSGRRVTGKSLARRVRALMSPEVKARCEAIRMKLDNTDGLARAADEVEAFAAARIGIPGRY